MTSTRPSCGAGTCASCHAALGLDAVKHEGAWYCSPACAQGRPAQERRAPLVPEQRLYHRPRRLYAPRRPKELRAAPKRP